VGADQAVVTTELPGVDRETIDVSVSGNVLTLKGSRNPEELKEDESYHRRERWHGEFSKTLDLPFDIEVQKVEAKFSKGILTVTLPRAEAEKPRKISIA
jgi:HSP20 family protein